MLVAVFAFKNDAPAASSTSLESQLDTALREKITLKGIPGALALGLVSGLVASQYATPVLAAVLTHVMAKGALLYGAGLLFAYALGRSLPIILAGTFTGVLKSLQAFGRWNEMLEKIAGVVVIAVGLYFVWIA